MLHKVITIYTRAFALFELPVHKIGGLREWLTERSVEVPFLPLYSPDSSPIEQAADRRDPLLRGPVRNLAQDHRLNYQSGYAKLV